MLWIVQKNLYTENMRGNLFHALDRMGVDYLAVEVEKNTITPDILDDSVPIITNGSIMLSNIARARGWTPGSMLNDNYSYDVWSDQYKDLLLNKNAKISTLKDAVVTTDQVFARPILDNKTFNGKLFTRAEFLQFQADSLNSKAGRPKPDTQILISQPKKIGQEHRHYIVDGEVVTSSRYKLAGQPNFSEGCDQAVINVVNEAIKIWTPSQAFVLDTYISGDEIGIVEIGCICHAGLYEANIMKLVNALDSMEIISTERKKLKP